jgi:hypothetical protein
MQGLKLLMLFASSLAICACGGGSSGSGAPIVATSTATSVSSYSSSSTSSSSKASSAGASSLEGRSLVDRPDKYVDDYQIHVIYAVPSDKPDQQHDIKRTFEVSLRAANNFFSKTTQQQFRFDEAADGSLDVSFLLLPSSDYFYASKLAFAREAVQTDVRAAGFTNPRKIYLVYYEGNNEATCGNAPAVGSGDGITVLYLHGLGSSNYPCDANPFSTNENIAGYWEWVPLHEIVHALSFVDTCAPHGKAMPSHTSDDPSDLMYAGSLAWAPTTIDPGHDDYYGENLPPSCPRNLKNSAFLVPQLGSEIPINFPHN